MMLLLHGIGSIFYVTTYSMILINFCSIISNVDAAETKLGRTSNNEFFVKPTPEELSWSVAVPPPSWWGEQLWKDRSIRLLCTGGSNTAQSFSYCFQMASKFPEVFKEFWDARSSYIKNAAIPSMGATKRSFDFEKEHHSKWPNVITLEYSVNMQATWTSVKEIDSMIKFIEAKWKVVNLRPPSLLFIEIFRAQPFYLQGGYTTIDVESIRKNCQLGDILESNNRSSIMLNLPDNFNYNEPSATAAFFHGNPNSPYYQTIARFYRIPLLSMLDSIFPSFTRWYNTHRECDIWPYTLDGHHLNEAGHKVLADDIITPYFKNFFDTRAAKTEASMNVNAAHHSAPFDVPVFMFPPSEYTALSVRVDHTSWGPNREHELTEIVDKRTNENFHLQSSLRHENDHNHICFGSTVKESSVVFKIVANPGNEREIYLTLGVGYLHSWNRSYVGDAECELFRSDATCTEFKESESGKIVLTGNLHNKQHVRDTTPRETIIAKASVTQGCHLLQCRNMDGKLSCFTRVFLLN